MSVIAHIGIGSKEREQKDLLIKIDKYIALSSALYDNPRDRRLFIFSFLLTLDIDSLLLFTKGAIAEFKKLLTYNINDTPCDELVEVSIQYIFKTQFKYDDSNPVSLNSNYKSLNRLCRQTTTNFLNEPIVSETRLKVNHISCIFSDCIKGCSIAAEPYGIENIQKYLNNIYNSEQLHKTS